MGRVRRLGSAAIAAAMISTALVPQAAFAQDPLDSPCWGITFPFAPPAGSAVFAVTQPGDDAAVAGTLRWAVEQAAAHDGPAEIVLDSGLVVESVGELTLSHSTVLRSSVPGSPAEVRHIGGSEPLFTEAGVDDFAVQLTDLRFTGTQPEQSGLDFSTTICALGLSGVTVSGFEYQPLVVGDTWPFVGLDVVNSVFADNGPRTDEPSSEAALAISNEGVSGTYSVRNSLFTGNRMTGFAVEAGLESGWDGMHGNVTVSDSVFEDNAGSEDASGGIRMEGLYFSQLDEEHPPADRTAPMLSVTNSRFVGNSGGGAGGILVQNVSRQADDPDELASFVVVEGSTFSGNTTGAAPGRADAPARDLAIESADGAETGASRLLAVTNSTFVGDAAVPSIHLASAMGETSLQHVTMVDSGVAIDAHQMPATVSFERSVFDGRSGGLITSGPAPGTQPDLVATEQFMAYTEAPSEAWVAPGPGRVVGTSAEFALGELADSSGPTPVFLPQPGSVLIDAAATPGAALDQRGIARPQGAGADIGAVELSSGVSTLQLGGDQRVDAGGALTFTVTRENVQGEIPWTGEVSAQVRAMDGSALAGTDFTAIEPTSLTWAAGDTAPKQVTIETGPGRIGGGELAMQLELTEPSAHAELGARTLASGTIVHPVEPGPKPEPKPKPEPEPKPELATTGGADAGLGLLLGAGLALAGAGALLFRRRAGER